MACSPARRHTRHDISPEAAPRDVVVVPGFLATDTSTSTLTSALRAAGHRTHPARLGTTNGCSERLASRLVARVDDLAATTTTGPITIIGHSRGGQLAKVAAQRRPQLVDRLITLGSPLTDQWGMHLSLKLLIGSMSLAGRAGLDIGGCDEKGCPFGSCSTEFTRDLASTLPPHIEFTSIYSRSDGITQWRTCLHPAARHVEVTCSHIAMISHPAVRNEALRLLSQVNPTAA
jgi:triacylglycerol lipase